jgi:dTDP-4-amino-4,6-dideoxygalactose transaminase
VDVDPGTFNINIRKLQAAVDALSSGNADAYPLPAASKMTPRGIIGVDIFGFPADYDAIAQIAEKQGMFVIEDAAQSFGAEYKGRKACSFGDIAASSFFPAKPLGCYGDGGMCFTNDAGLAEKMKSIRVHGKGGHKYDNARKGMKIFYDPEVDAAYLRLSEEAPTGVVEVSEGLNLDLTEEGKIVGIEILNASKNFPLQSLFTCEYEPKLMTGTA